MGGGTECLFSKHEGVRVMWGCRVMCVGGGYRVMCMGGVTECLFSKHEGVRVMWGVQSNVCAWGVQSNVCGLGGGTEYLFSKHYIHVVSFVLKDKKTVLGS